MDSRSRLDYALFQLTPTRTRCDLVICAGDFKEKLASGLLEPFIAHLKFAKDQISKGGYSITLSASDSSWFTKSTLERFVRFVNTPEVLERFITIEREIANIDCSINTSSSSDSQTVYGFGEHSNESSTSAYKVYQHSTAFTFDSIFVQHLLGRLLIYSHFLYIQHEGNTSDAIHEEDSKIHLQRVLETRKAVLQKEQAMVYARAIVAGFETDNLEDLICFADAFGSPRLREACLNFMELCNTKSNDRVWMDEVAAMQASSHSQYSYLGTSDGVLPGEDDPSQELRINIQNDNFATKKQNGAVDGSHLPQYMHFYQSGPMFQPPYQGYPFPGMGGPPYNQGNLPWSQNVEDSRRRGKRSQTKRSRELKQDGNFDSSDSSSGSDSGSYRRSSSRKVVIRNINYITSTKDGEAEWVSDGNSSNGAVNQDLDRTVEDKPEGQKVTTQQWDTFQILLMKDADDKVSEDVKKTHTSDPFILVERDLFDENNNRLPEIATKSSTIGGHERDWFLGSIPDIQEKSRDIFEDHFKSVESTKDVLVDDPLAVHARSLNELSDSQLRRQDILVVSESNLTQKAPYSPKKNVEAECVNEASDLCVMLERDTSGQQAMAVWTPEMELGNSNDKIVKLDCSEEGLERKDSTIEAKSKPLVGSLGKSKSNIISGSKKSTGTKTGKSEKEEEKRKKMEELLIQRQKRIAERSASTAKTAKNDKPKAELASRGMKRSNKPVIRSSTIDRLSAARVVNPKVLPTESKHGNKPTKVITKENGEPKPGKKPMKVATKENGESKPTKKPMKVTTKENGRSEPGKRPAKVLTKENGGSKPAKKPMKVFTKENGESKPPKKPMKVITKENGESKPPKKPMKVITKENGESKPPKTPMKVTTKNGISSTLFSQRTVGVGKREAKPQKVEHLDKDIGLKNSNGPKKKIVVLTNAKQLPRTSPIKKIGNGVAGIGLSEPPNYRSSQSDNKKGVSKTLHKKASSALQEDIALSGGNNGSTNKAKNSVSFSISEDISAKERRVVKANDEMMEISTPPPGKGSPERSNSRKKWSNIGTSSKALSGFRKLLSFGKRS
ncbi:COP1-interacting protein 7-like [Cynara cardunculus var. scolymus]|uniref:COP1-interacting protein 7-like n=1 Tax=Cynara cardunculus var. scolymus TaxID=59895 RepID=UPI000D625F62|nr:COP1-interacting protein 7-like [Cynara cardunculus var. scolymus]